MKTITLNNQTTDIRYGDNYMHRFYGKGMIVAIKENAKYPIKMHFPEKSLFAFFDINGKQFENQIANIQFPIIPERN